MTHTYAELEISQAAWDEIAQKLRDAGYDHAFVDGKTIDMHGIGLTPAAEPPNMVRTPEGQLFFRYPPREQPIDRMLAGMKHGDRYTTEDGTPMLVIDTRLGETPAREIEQPLHIFDKAGR
jgi:hypothetical protein